MDITVLDDYQDYGVTRAGRIFSRKSGTWRKLKPQTDTDGYLQVRLYKNGRGRLTFIHDIVANTFLKKPRDCYEVNHKDGNKKNNNVSNLEWSTRSDNMLHAHSIGLINTQKPIVATDLKSGNKFVFPGQRMAARCFSVNQANINHALKRKNGTAYGYRFEYLKGGDINGSN